MTGQDGCIAMEAPGTIAVLVMAYGGPGRIEDVEPYILDVRNHRPTPRAVLDEMRSRYLAIGGRSPILERTRAQAIALGAALRDAGTPLPVYLAMRHWHPYIAAACERMRGDGIKEVIGVVMAAHYSHLSVGAYFGRLAEAAGGIAVRPVESWHLLPEYIDTVESLVHDALDSFPQERRSSVHLLFTAHSLPERALTDDDPYPVQLKQTVAAVAARFSGQPHSFAYQSAAMTSDVWLGPDAGDVMQTLAETNCSSILFVPIGFTSEHVEILFDIDIEYARIAQRLGLEMRRIRMMNEHPHLMGGLARRVIEEIAAVAH